MTDRDAEEAFQALRLRAIGRFDQLVAEHDEHLRAVILYGMTSCPVCRLLSGNSRTSA